MGLASASAEKGALTPSVVPNALTKPKSDWDYDSDEEGDEEEGEFPKLPDLPGAMKELVRCMIQHGVEPQFTLDMELVVS
jgi:hypothetical protein